MCAYMMMQLIRKLDGNICPCVCLILAEGLLFGGIRDYCVTHIFISYSTANSLSIQSTKLLGMKNRNVTISVCDENCVSSTHSDHAPFHIQGDAKLQRTHTHIPFAFGIGSNVFVLSFASHFTQHTFAD